MLRTTYGQLRGEKSRDVVPKRHQRKHLEFFDSLVRDQEVDGANPFAPTNLLESATYKMRKSIERLVQGQDVTG